MTVLALMGTRLAFLQRKLLPLRNIQAAIWKIVLLNEVKLFFPLIDFNTVYTNEVHTHTHTHTHTNIHTLTHTHIHTHKDTDENRLKSPT